MSDIADAAPRILRDIQQNLREMKLTADMDRRNNRSLYDNLAFEVARQIGMLDAKLELLAERVESLAERLDERSDRIEAMLAEIAGKLTG